MFVSKQCRSFREDFGTFTEKPSISTVLLDTVLHVLYISTT